MTAADVKRQYDRVVSTRMALCKMMPADDRHREVSIAIDHLRVVEALLQACMLNRNTL